MLPVCTHSPIVYKQVFLCSKEAVIQAAHAFARAGSRTYREYRMKIDYYAYRSGMRCWNAGLKMFLAVITLCLVIAFDKPAVSVYVIFTMGALTLMKGKIPWKAYIHFMTVPLAFMVFSGAAIAVEFGRAPLGDWNLPVHFFWICLYQENLVLAGRVFLKAMAGMSALYMMSLATPVSELVLVLQRLHIPRLLVELMNLIYRYIFILIDVSEQMQIAAKARLGCHSFRQSCKSFAQIAGNLFLVSLKKANAYYDALLSRGYDGKLEFLSEENPPAGGQLVFTGLYLLILLGIAVIV